METTDTVWKSDAVVNIFLESVRGGIPFADTQIDILLRLMEARGEPVEGFADLGCGNGILASATLARHPHARGVLVDFSEPMLEQARLHLSAHSSQLRFVSADLGKPPWVNVVRDQAPLDVILSGFAIHHQPDERKRELYQEIFSLLKPGGLFVNIEHVASATPWLESIFDEHFIDTLHAFHTRRGSDRSRTDIASQYYYRPDKAANILAPVETQCQWLREIGFQDVDCYFKVFELAVFGGRRPKENR